MKNATLILAQSRCTPSQTMSQSWWSICSLIQNKGVPHFYQPMGAPLFLTWGMQIALPTKWDAREQYLIMAMKQSFESMICLI